MNRIHLDMMSRGGKGKLETITPSTGDIGDTISPAIAPSRVSVDASTLEMMFTINTSSLTSSSEG
ncbi:hypothetical protein [Bremerella alba]|uniref:hypothetical protein n=1 Tax=Bremerella alba TaxID=980252 RepID=UPI001A954B3E|nr:hypothetical protein [Bremerella alba]